MANYWNEYPPHIKYLIEDLESNEEILSVLMKYITTLPTDPILSEIFKNLGYAESTETFMRVPLLEEALRYIHNYYEVYQPDYYEYLNDT